MVSRRPPVGCSGPALPRRELVQSEPSPSAQGERKRPSRTPETPPSDLAPPHARRHAPTMLPRPHAVARPSPVWGTPPAPRAPVARATAASGCSGHEQLRAPQSLLDQTLMGCYVGGLLQVLGTAGGDPSPASRLVRTPETSSAVGHHTAWCVKS